MKHYTAPLLLLFAALCTGGCKSINLSHPSGASARVFVMGTDTAVEGFNVKIERDPDTGETRSTEIAVQGYQSEQVAAFQAMSDATIRAFEAGLQAAKPIP